MSVFDRPGALGHAGTCRLGTTAALMHVAACAIVPGTLPSSPEPAHVPDSELARIVMQGASPGAAAAEAQLCARFAPRIMAYGRRHLADEAWARDLTQRVLLLTIEKLRAGAVREPDRISSFVLGVARTLSREIQRGRARDEQLRPEPPAADLAARLPELEPLGMEHLRDCLAALAERERAVVVLSFFDERSSTEIGQALGLSGGNVRVIRHRAIDRLRRCMGLETVSA